MASDSAIPVTAGLLLPIWKRLPNESMRVYRLQTDDGERIIGRKVSPACVAGALAMGAGTLGLNDAFAALIDGKTFLDLAEGLQLRRVRVMGANRIELSGFTDTMRERLSAYCSDGHCSEIIADRHAVGARRYQGSTDRAAAVSFEPQLPGAVSLNATSS